MGPTPIVFTATVLRKQPDLPRYVIVKAEHVKGRNASFDALVSLNNCAAFLRRIHPWGKGSDAFFFNLTQPQCRKAEVETGDRCKVRIEPVA